MDLEETFANNLRGLRIAKGLTQERAAREVGVNLQTYGNWERRTLPSVVNLKKLSEFFNVSVEVLLARPQAPAPEKADILGDLI